MRPTVMFQRWLWVKSIEFNWVALLMTKAPVMFCN